MRALISLIAVGASMALATVAVADPQYNIYDVGVVQMGDTASQGFGASPGGVAVGRSFRSGGTQAFTWSLGGGLVGLPNLSGRAFCVSNSANDTGTVVGTGATTAFGSGRLPVIWQNGVVSQLPLPSGQSLGDANHVNASGVAVGSVDAGSTQRGAIYSGGSATIISQTTPGGSFFVTAFGINDSGRVVGQGIDPNNAARNVGIVFDLGSNAAFEVGALNGMNGALAFGVSNAGHVVGSSMLNQGSGQPFIWTAAGGIVAIPLAAGTSQGSARAVNSDGWTVGNDSSAFSIPFLYDGTATYRLADVIPAGSGWDLSMNTSSSALGIGDNAVIVGTGVFNGNTHAYAMVPTLQLVSAISSRVHGTGGVFAGTFDIPLPLSGPAGVECRSSGVGGKYTFVLSFTNAVTAGSASVSSGSGVLSGPPTFDGKTMAISLASVSDAQTIVVTFSGVTDSFGQTLPSTTVSARFLIGDVNGSGTVTASDIAAAKSEAGATANVVNFRADIDANGTVTSSDIGQVKVNSGHFVP